MNRHSIAFILAINAYTAIGHAADLSLHDRALQLVGCGRMAEAEVMLQQALAVDSAESSPPDPDRRLRQLSTLDVLASLAHVRGDDARAEALLRRAVTLAGGPPRLRGVSAAGILSGLARLLLLRGDERQARQLASRSLKLYEKVEGAQRVERADALATLAMIIAARGDLPRAQALLREARRAVEVENGRPALHALVLGHLGALRMAQGRYAEAESLLEQGLEFGVQAMGDDHPALVPLMDALAECYRVRTRGNDATLLSTRARGIARFAFGSVGGAAR